MPNDWQGSSKKMRAKPEILSRKTSRQSKIYNLRYRQKEDEGRVIFNRTGNTKELSLEAGFYGVAWGCLLRSQKERLIGHKSGRSFRVPPLSQTESSNVSERKRKTFCSFLYQIGEKLGHGAH